MHLSRLLRAEASTWRHTRAAIAAATAVSRSPQARAHYCAAAGPDAGDTSPGGSAAAPSDARAGSPWDNDWVVPPQTLRGSCGCGSVGWQATGPSAVNFVCHCSVCRGASGEPSLPAAAFKPGDVAWVNDAGIDRVTPHGSRNVRMFCKSCGDYVGEDATRPLGVIALPLSRVAGPLHDSFRPNNHIFYADRVEDVRDELPKWRTLPQGVPLTENGQVATVPRQLQGRDRPRIASSVSATPAAAPAAAPAGGGASVASGAAHGAQDHSQWQPSTGRYRKDVLSVSPTRPPDPLEYVFPESDPLPNHVTLIRPDMVRERVAHKYDPSPGAFVAPSYRDRDVVIIGGGHNGLVAAAYLAKAGVDVLVLERRDIVGGAAVTEEIFPGYKFSRGSYLAGLLRPAVIDELDLHRHGLRYISRDPSSFTPSRLDGPLRGKYLMLGDDADATWRSIAQFSESDADAYFKYEEFLGKVRAVVRPLLDGPPPDLTQGRFEERRRAVAQLRELGSMAWKHRDVLVPFYELFTAPASHILDRFFESEILKTTLATDAVIGAQCSPTDLGSAYVLLHHVMGEANGKQGVWSYVEGGMGAVSDSIAAAAREYGAEICTNATVDRITYADAPGTPEGTRATGVVMQDGTEVRAKTVVAGCGAYHAFLELLPGLARDSGHPEESPLPHSFQRHIRFADHSCGAFKINCAVDRLPNFECCPTDALGAPGPQHNGTVHFETTMQELELAFRESSMGMPATRPVVEMTIPSALDTTLAPPGKHVVQLFVQFAPYTVDPKHGNWADPTFKQAFVERCFRVVDDFAPGFSASVTGIDALSPLDLERVFGLHQGNISHGALSLHQLGYARPAFGYSSYRTPMKDLYLCSAAAHPGGGVMGAAGRNAAMVMLSDMGVKHAH